MNKFDTTPGAATTERLDGKWFLLKNNLKNLKNINIEDFPSLTQFYNYYIKEDVGAHLVEKHKAEKVIELQEELKGKENEEIDLNTVKKLSESSLILEEDLKAYENLLNIDKRLENGAFSVLKGITNPDKIKNVKESLLKKDLTYEKTLIEDCNKKIEYLKSIDLGSLNFDDYIDLIKKTSEQFDSNLNSKKR